ncbi:hypothetical protein TNCT_722491 [Trichonephila clavata]|uniref:Uncharacterized protein n=1 Tax=Trichonephila clavata TaxID=2740835 RepID=A0A8X6HSM5_TRICU|nr:hypothetical protein TNCT_722491 [Trichonephila clavata]
MHIARHDRRITITDIPTEEASSHTVRPMLRTEISGKLLNYSPALKVRHYAYNGQSNIHIGQKPNGEKSGLDR